MDASCEFAAGVETLKGLVLGVQNLGVVVDFDAAHGEVEDRLHDGDVEGVIDVEGEVVEEFLAKRIFLLAVSDGVVVFEGLLQCGVAAANFLREFFAAHFLHEATAGVVPGVEVEDVGGFGVEHEADGPFLRFFLLPHLTRDVVAVA